MTVIDSTFTGIAGTYGGAIYCQTGGSVTVSNSTFTGNSGSGSSGDSGGAIVTNGCNLVVSGSTFFNNFTLGLYGGAIQSGASATVSITNSTFVGNSDSPGSMGGGAIFNASTGTVANNTFSGNSAAGTSGGAIYSDAALTVSNNIFIGNSAGQGAAIFDDNHVVTAAYNLFYNNLAAGSESDCSGCTSTNSSFGVNPKLLPLGSYGGTTETMALAPGSPAVCEGNSADAVNAGATAHHRPTRLCAGHNLRLRLWWMPARCRPTSMW